jgi:pantoate--beta-alanine ligase
MHIIDNKKDLSEILKACMGQSVGFVPTMGALHDGHLSLIRKSSANNDHTICSIFVNPTQFNNPADLEKYPRTLQVDIAKLEELKVDFLYIPDSNEMYPEGVKSNDYILDGMDTPMEGVFRPGHFQGVATIVDRLIEHVNPTRMYLGQKDLQQFMIIQAMIKHVKHNVELVMCPIYREPNGLAMSSRNELLSYDEREKLGIIHDCLLMVKNQMKAHEPVFLKQKALKMLEECDLVKDVEYFEIVDAKTLQAIDVWSNGSNPVACVALNTDSVRLIDNMFLIY